MTTTFPEPTRTTEPLPVEYLAPLVTPGRGALYAATEWPQDDAVPRWLTAGLAVRRRNYGLGDAVGIWGADWCGEPGDEIKTGTRPTSLDPFDPVTVWGYDECDLTAASRTETHARAAHNLAMLEPVAIEREVAGRLLTDAGVPADRAGVQAAVGYLEGQLAQTNTLGLIHCSPEHVGFLDDAGLIRRDGGAPSTPLGSRWVFGGGYVTGLTRTLVATSPTVGWRTEAEVRDAIDPQTGTGLTIAERSVLIGYETVVGAARLV